jgi:hypothetical protein
MPLQPLPLANGQHTHTHFDAFEIVTCAVLIVPLTVPVTPLPLASPSTKCHMFPPTSNVELAGVATKLVTPAETLTVCEELLEVALVPTATEHHDR